MGVILGHLDFLCLSKRLFLLFPFALISFNGQARWNTVHYCVNGYTRPRSTKFYTTKSLCLIFSPIFKFNCEFYVNCVDFLGVVMVRAPDKAACWCVRFIENINLE